VSKKELSTPPSGPVRWLIWDLKTKSKTFVVSKTWFDARAQAALILGAEPMGLDGKIVADEPPEVAAEQAAKTPEPPLTPPTPPKPAAKAKPKAKKVKRTSRRGPRSKRRGS